jgi:hypothetical protein
VHERQIDYLTLQEWLRKEATELKATLDDLMTSDLAVDILGVAEHAKECRRIHHRLNEINAILSG